MRQEIQELEDLLKGMNTLKRRFTESVCSSQGIGRYRKNAIAIESEARDSLNI